MADMTKALGSSSNPNWITPWWLVHYFENEVLHSTFDLDPCASKESAKAEKWFGQGSPWGEDGLAEPWFGDVFMNPPYGRGIGPWVKKAYSEVIVKKNTNSVTALLPARTDTIWWLPCFKAAFWYMCVGRIHFQPYENDSSPAFPSIIAVFKRGRRLSIHQGPVVRKLVITDIDTDKEERREIKARLRKGRKKSKWRTLKKPQSGVIIAGTGKDLTPDLSGKRTSGQS